MSGRSATEGRSASVNTVTVQSEWRRRTLSMQAEASGGGRPSCQNIHNRFGMSLCVRVCVIEFFQININLNSYSCNHRLHHPSL